MIEALAIAFTVAVLGSAGAYGLAWLLEGPPHGRPEHAYRCELCDCTYRSSACLVRHCNAQHPVTPEPPS